MQSSPPLLRRSGGDCGRLDKRARGVEEGGVVGSRDLHAARTLVLDVLAEGASSRLRERAEYRLQRLERKMAVRERGGLMAALEE